MVSKNWGKQKGSHGASDKPEGKPKKKASLSAEKNNDKEDNE